MLFGIVVGEGVREMEGIAGYRVAPAVGCGEGVDVAAGGGALTITVGGTVGVSPFSTDNSVGVGNARRVLVSGAFWSIVHEKISRHSDKAVSGIMAVKNRYTGWRDLNIGISISVLLAGNIEFASVVHSVLWYHGTCCYPYLRRAP